MDTYSQENELNVEDGYDLALVQLIIISIKVTMKCIHMYFVCCIVYIGMVLQCMYSGE